MQLKTDESISCVAFDASEYPGRCTLPLIRKFRAIFRIDQAELLCRRVHTEGIHIL